MSFGSEFRISARSMAALEKHADQAYLDRLVTLVAGLAPPDEPASQIRQRCRELVRKGRSHGFETEREIAAYVACGFAAGMDFDKRPPYCGILESPGMSAGSKAELLTLVLENAESEESDDKEG